MIIFRKRFERKFEEAFGFPVPRTVEELELYRERMIEKMVCVGTDAEEAFLKIRKIEKELKAYRKNPESDPTGGVATILGVFSVILNAQIALDCDTIFGRQRRLARKVGLPKAAIRDVDRRVVDEAEVRLALQH